MPKTKQHLAMELYQAYPRKAARGAALVAILKALDKESPEYLLERVRTFAAATAQWPPSDRFYIPHCATFMNQERYADDEAEWMRNAVQDQGWKPTVSLEQAKELLSDDTADTE